MSSTLQVTDMTFLSRIIGSFLVQNHTSAHCIPEKDCPIVTEMVKVVGRRALHQCSGNLSVGA